MNPRRLRYAVLSVLIVWLAVAGVVLAGQDAPGVSGGCAVAWAPHVTDKGRHVNLGPTGAKGWVDGEKIRVLRVAKGSPADGVLRAGDVIVGAGGVRFTPDEDPRRTLGKAIGESETQPKRGVLALTLAHGKRTRTVTLRLRVMGSYSATWPFQCGKSERVLDDACRWLAGRQYPNGFVDGEFGMSVAWGGLLFLASGEAKYLDNARRAAYWLADQKFATAKIGLNNWPRSYIGIFLAEYYLATGDATVLPEVKALALAICEGQMKCGSWGHNSPWDGYGAVNQVGLTCWLALVLTQECGFRVDEGVMRRARVFFKKYAGKGWIPYGDHKPWLGNNGNGKDAIAAVIFDLLGEAEVARQYSRSVAAAQAYREEGHTGSFFSIMWGPPAALLAGTQRFRKFMDYQKWYYDLCRAWDGGVVSLPNKENLSGRTPGSYTYCGPESTTGGLALVYAMPRKKLRIFGAPRGVFGRQKKPAGDLAEARTLFVAKKWPALKACLARCAKKKGASERDKQLLAQLRAALERQTASVSLTAAVIERDIRVGDVYRASVLLKGLDRLLGKDHVKLPAIRESLKKNEQWVVEGEKYYQAWAKLREFSWQYWHYYGRRAWAILGDTAPLPAERWDALIATSEEKPQTWKVFQWGDVNIKNPPPLKDATWDKLQGWNRPGFDDAKWPATAGPTTWQKRHILLRKTFTVANPAAYARLRLNLSAPRDAAAEVYLNGKQIAEIVRGPGRRAMRIDLSDAAAALPRKGENLLAVHCRLDSPGRGSLDVGLEAAPTPGPR